MRTEKQLNEVAESVKSKAIEFAKNLPSHAEQLVAEWAYLAGAAQGYKLANEEFDAFVRKNLKL